MVGLDVVEVSPAYDTNAELTGMAAADLVQEFLSILMKRDGPEVAVRAGKLTGGAKRVEEKKGGGRDEL